jgi:hypothetical protein
MIKIEIDNIETIKREYFDGIKKLILDRVNFYLAVFKVIDRQAGFTINTILNYGQLGGKTKTACLKIIARSQKSFTNRNHYGRLRNQNSLSVHFYNQRAGYINLLTVLSDENNLRALILAEVNDLVSTNNSYYQAWFTGETKHLINEIIPYDEFIKKETIPYNAYDLTDNLKVNVCAYCNRVYTNTVIGRGRDLIIRPTFDHYFHQSQYPLLALSFYNLIPACNYCNSNLKRQIPFTLHLHMHPYLEGFGKDATFDYLQIGFHSEKSDPRNYRVLLNDNITYPNMKHPRMFGNTANPDTGNVNVFKLREVYQGHADVVGELIVKSDKLSPYYAGNIIKMLTNLGASKKEFYRYYFGNYLDEKEFNKRPLAKLTKDIVTKYLPELLD